MRPDGEVPAGLPVRTVLWLLAAHPWRYVVRRWNYKSATTSSLIRAGLFFGANLPAGFDAAIAAMGVEFLFRLVTAGFYGAFTQAFRRAVPVRQATVAALLCLPALGHSVEFLVHLSRGTPCLVASLAVSLAFTALSTAFNLFAMRHGALIVGTDSRPLWRDLMSMPALLLAFCGSWRSRRCI